MYPRGTTRREEWPSDGGRGRNQPAARSLEKFFTRHVVDSRQKSQSRHFSRARRWVHCGALAAMPGWSSSSILGGHAGVVARASPEILRCYRRGTQRWTRLVPSKSHIKKSRQRVPPRCDATSNDSSQQPETRRVSKSGPSSSYTETWDGKYPMETQGMWDTSGIQGPSCFILPPLDVASKQDLEKVYAQAKNTYFSGQPIISDGMFDEIERRLRALGSDAAKKYPRCSRRDMKIYGDLESDNEQMKNLQNVCVT